MVSQFGTRKSFYLYFQYIARIIETVAACLVLRLRTPLDSQSMVRYDPLFLSTARDLRGRDRAFDAVNFPAVL